MNQENISVNPYANQLRGFLNLQPPSTSKASPSIFEFERFRELEVNWFDITSQTTGGAEPIEDLKGYFIGEWKTVISSEHHKIFGDTELFYTLKETGKPWNQVFWKLADIYLNGDKIKYTQAICFLHKPSNRLYAFVNKNNIPATELLLGWTPTITNKDAWESLYANGKEFTSLVIAYENDVEAIDFASRTTYVKREAILFKEEYERLNSQWAFIEQFNTRSDAYIKDLFSNNQSFQKFWDDEEELDKTGNTFSNLKTKSYSILQKLRQLAAKVKEYGYFLALQDDTIGTTPPVEVKKGTIYQVKQDTYLRKDVVRRQEWRKIRDGKNETWVRVWIEVPKWIPVKYNNYIPVTLLDDPVEDAIVDLRKNNYHVFFGHKKNGGYYTEEGVAIRDVLERCEKDEAFRRTCAVVIPQYDILISNKSYYLGAFIFTHPLPGLVPDKHPSIGIREELSYRLAWKGTEIGQLISSINLAPGETRTITVSSKFKQTTSQTASFKSINDVNTSESFDLATEFQKEASQEFNKSESFQASASGGFGVGPFSASASASGSRSTNLKTFSRDMSRVAKKSSQSINRKLSTEITSSSSFSTEVSQETSKAITISNINQGSTLNLLFYQINNKYDSALYLTSLEVLISSTKELIAGSGLFETYSYRIHELDDIFSKLHPDLLPGKNPLPEEPDAWKKYWESLIELFTTAIKNEYDITGGMDSPKVVRFLKSPQFEKRAYKILENTIGTQSANDLQKNGLIRNENILELIGYAKSPCDKFKILKAGLPSLEILEKPVGMEDLLIASGGLYVDSMVGVVPATEYYSEYMRKLEGDRIQSEIEKTQSSNDETRARTRLLTQSQNNYIAEVWTYENTTPPDTYTIQLQLFKAVADDKWRVFLNNAEISNPTIRLVSGNKVMLISMPGDLKDSDEIENSLMLVHSTTSEILKKYW